MILNGRGVWLVALGAVVCGLAAGCEETNPQVLFSRCRYAECEQVLRPQIPDAKHKDYALVSLQYSSAALEAGDLATAAGTIAKAEAAMNEIEGGGDTAAVVVAESLKTYRGDPYEKGMAHLYSGFLALQREDHENALAAFRRALIADQDTRTENPDQKQDFVAAHYFAGLAYHLLDENENAHVHLEQASRYTAPNAMLTLGAVSTANTFLLITSGYGPFKIASGPGGSIAAISKPPDPVTQVRLECDGSPLGDAAFLDDLLTQAAAQGLGEMDKIRIAKGVSKEVLAQVPYASLFSSAIHAEADVRVWSFLPGRLYVWAGRLEPGLHTLALRCSGPDAGQAAACDQVWFYVPVKAEKLNFLNFRLAPFRQDVTDKVLVPVTALPEKKGK